MSQTIDILMIATGQQAVLLDKLIGSIEPGTVKVHLIVVNQGTSKKFEGKENLEVSTLNINRPLSLSAARNKGLKFSKKQGLQAIHVMFPDDDTTFDPAFFESYSTLVKPEKAYLGRVCAEEDGSDYKAYPKQTQLKGTLELLPYVASVALIIPQKVVKQVGMFDEKLGAGAEYGSSEDLDYFIRCTKITPFSFVKALRNFHPSRFGKYDNLDTEQIKKRFKSYSDGYLFVMFRYGLDQKAKSLTARAVGGAAFSLLKGNVRLVPIYLWLARYRFSLHRYFKVKKEQNPEFFRLNEA